MEPIYQTARANLDRLAELLGKPADLNTNLYGPNGQAGLAYLATLTDQHRLNADLLGPLLPLLAEDTVHPDELAMRLPQADPRPCSHLDAALADLTAGRALLFLSGAPRALSFAAPGWPRHEPREPLSERTIRGPREGFTETLAENISMIRRWIKDHRLRVEETAVGRRTRTAVAVMYLADVAQPRLIGEIYRRLTAIDIDGVIESGYLEQLIQDRRLSIFPLTQATERTDKAAAAILEGRAAILVDKSPFVLLAPATINELYQSPEDYYFGFWLGSFLRLTRLLGNNLAIALPGLYVALVAVNPELLPTQFILAIAAARMRIPIPLVAEVLLLELAVEVFREAGLRLPGTIGETLGIVAGIVLGITGIQAGLISPATLAVVAITAVASFTGPSFAAGIAWRLLKYFMLAAGAVMGLYGLTLAGMLILIHAADLKSFGVSYLAPWSPLQWRDLANGPVLAPIWARWLRPATYRSRDKKRFGGSKREDDEND